ncbi:hypothetical protein [Plantactinospora sp. CA-290183]|uniref:hypothetical protein n=1 Tax=Plantactinospora sp. CA-290183 TaxID=3240006 RepID=UPI003D8ACBED
MSDTVILGELTCPSGELVVIDAGYLSLWSGEDSPAEVPSGSDALASAHDLEIVGPDAEAAARSFDRQAGVTCYDIPEHGLADFTALFDQHCRDKGLDARLRPVARVPHRERVRRCVARGGEEFIVFGVPAVAVGGVPTARRLPVVATRSDFGPPIGENWHGFRVPFGDRRGVDRRLLGYVGVDHGGVVFADADALTSWQHERPSDGLADVAFWGREAAEAAEASDAAPLTRAGDEDAYGWHDLPVEQARERAAALADWQQADPARALVVDFRPHSDHFQLMAGVRASPAEAGAVTVGGADLVGAMTGYGDGLFEVHLEVAADGTAAGLELLFATPEHLTRYADFLRRYS